MKNWRPLHGMTGSMEAELESPAHHQEGGAGGLPLSSLESDWTCAGLCVLYC